jgi:hypothetical protein
MNKKCNKKCGSCDCSNGQLPLKIHLGTAGNLIIKKAVRSKSGELGIVYDCDDQFIEFYKSEAGVKRVTKSGLTDFIKELLKNKIDKIIQDNSDENP